jgi:hypothetical protein
LRARALEQSPTDPLHARLELFIEDGEARVEFERVEPDGIASFRCSTPVSGRRSLRCATSCAAVGLRALLDLCKERGLERTAPEAFDKLFQAVLDVAHAQDDSRFCTSSCDRAAPNDSPHSHRTLSSSTEGEPARLNHRKLGPAPGAGTVTA